MTEAVVVLQVKSWAGKQVRGWLVTASISSPYSDWLHSLLTHDSASDSLSVGNRLELETMFKSFDTMIVRSRSTTNNQFVVYPIS